MTRQYKVLIVDDEPAIRFAVRDYLEMSGVEVEEAEDGRSARRMVDSARPDAIVLDYRLPDGDSLDLIGEIKAFHKDVAIIVLTAHGSIDLAVTAVKLGADHFMTKPVEVSELKAMIDRLVRAVREKKPNAAPRPPGRRPLVNPFVGTSVAIAELKEHAMRLVGSDRPVLIQGETGTGKGVLAQWLHQAGSRGSGPFVDLNCAALSRELVESELFGHERGAFTGAVATKQGLLEIANGGTLFLDEIGDMDLGLQAKLLKVVEDSRFRRVGEVRDRTVDVRLIHATHRDLPALVRGGAFRGDLYFRINTLALTMPPLRFRREDIPELTGMFLHSLSRESSRPPLTLSAAALDLLRSHPWPGNIRELRNVIERAFLLTDGSTITPSDIAFDQPSAPNDPYNGDSLADLERRHVLRILGEEEGHVERAAQRLEIPRSSLYHKLKKYRE